MKGAAKSGGMTARTMRSIVSILSVTLLASTLAAKPMIDCQAKAGATPGGACHHAPAQPTPCQWAEAGACLDFICAPDRLTAIAPAPTGQATSPGPDDQSPCLLTADGVAPSTSRDQEMMAAHCLTIHHAAGKLFLRNRVLVI